MNFLDDLAVKQINQPISIEFKKVVKKVRDNPKEFFCKLAGLQNLSSIKLSGQILCTNDNTIIQPLSVSEKLLDLGLPFNDYQLAAEFTRLTRLVLRSRYSPPLRLDRFGNLREFDHTDYLRQEEFDYAALPNPTTLTKLILCSFTRQISLQQFKRFCNLKVVNFSIDRQIKQHVLQEVPLTSLEQLTIRNIEIRLESLSKNLNLTSLTIKNQRMDWRQISKLSRLQDLSVTSRSINIKQLAHIPCLQLRSVSLCATNSPLVNHFDINTLTSLNIELTFNSPQLNDISRLTALQSLTLESSMSKRQRSCPRYAVDVSTLTRLTRLKLQVPQLQCTNMQMLTNLEDLFTENPVTERGVIEHLTNLTSLRARTIEDAEQLSKVTKLEQFYSIKTSVTDTYLCTLTNMKALTVKSISSVGQLQLPKLQFLKIDALIDHDVYLSLSSLTQLTYLAAGSKTITPEIQEGYPMILMTRLQYLSVYTPLSNFAGFKQMLVEKLPYLCWITQ